MKAATAFVAGLLVVTCAGASSAQVAIPFPKALDAAAISVDRLDSILEHGLILGNGDVNALLHSDGGAIVLRLTKNDVWDARLDSKLDPPLPTMKRIKEMTASGGIAGGGRAWILPEGSKWRGPDSYHAHPYPCPRACGVVRIAAGSAKRTCPARLDIRRAVADVPGTKGGLPKAQIRALAGRNVFLIHTTADVTLEGVKSAGIPEFSTGKRDGVRWLAQEIPGDGDWPGMRFAVALSADGKTNRKAVAIVTSREAKDPLSAALALARETLKADAKRTIESHEARWRRFWSASGVDLGEGLLRDTWYRNLYFLRCVSRPGAISPGLFAGLIHDKPAWHGDYHTNYNIQQTFWTAYVTNHADLAEPYDRLVREYLPRARWLAGKVFDCGGAYYPHVLFAYEPADPAKCKGPTRRQYIHHVWGFTLGVNGFTAQPLWWHYKYAPNRSLLEKVVYPVVREVAVFQADFMDTCKRDKSGKVVLGPSVSPEHWGWTKNFARNYNGTFDIAMFRYIFRAAVEGATTLGRDEKLVAGWKKALASLPDYPTTKGPDPIVVDVQGAPPITYNIAVPAVPVFPADVVTWWSPEKQKRLFARTIQQCRWNGNNSIIILGVARARLSMPGTPDWLRAEIRARLRPNKTITLNRLGAGFNNFGHYTEQFAATMAVSELLLQSVGDIIRVFPAWPKDKPARFENLRAQGGFLVSAEQAGGKIPHVKVTSTVGGKLRLLSPWPKIAVRRSGKSEMLKADQRGIVALDTRPGEELTFAAGG